MDYLAILAPYLTSSSPPVTLSSLLSSHPSKTPEDSLHRCIIDLYLTCHLHLLGLQGTHSWENPGSLLTASSPPQTKPTYATLPPTTSSNHTNNHTPHPYTLLSTKYLDANLASVPSLYRLCVYSTLTALSDVTGGNGYKALHSKYFDLPLNKGGRGGDKDRKRLKSMIEQVKAVANNMPVVTRTVTATNSSLFLIAVVCQRRPRGERV